MGYTHYWYREDEIQQDTFQKISHDLREASRILTAMGVKLADGNGDGEPVMTEDMIVFNGSRNCGHPVNESIIIPWPSKIAAGIAEVGENAIGGQWVAGALLDKRMCNGDCSYETFYFPRVLAPESTSRRNGKLFGFTKKAYRPYDLAVTVALVIAKHYLADKIIVRSDGEMKDWVEAMALCHVEFGYGMDFQLTKGG